MGTQGKTISPNARNTILDCPSAEFEEARNTDDLNHQRSTEVLKKSDARYHRLLKSLPEIFYSFSLKTGGLYYSPRVEDILGYSPEQLSERPNLWHDSIHPDDLAMVDKAIVELQNGKNFDLQYRIHDANGDWHWFHDHNILIRGEKGEEIIDGIVTDITKYRRNEEILRISEERFRDFASAASEWFWEMGPDLRFTFFSEQADERLGISTDKFIGKSRRQIGQVGSNVEGWETHLADLDAHRPFQGFEYEVKHGNFISVSGTPVFKDDGVFLGYRGIGTNITERVIADKELKRHRDHLEELVAQRTAEVQDKAAQLEVALTREKEYNLLQKKFIALVSHEFRTPLAIIDGAAQRLLRHKASLPADEVESRVGKIRSAVTRMVDQIDTTLYASLLDEGKIDFVMLPCDLANVLVDVCERQSELTPDYQIKVMVDDLPDKVRGDSRLLDQVFTNLLSNAVKYSQAVSSIEVKGWQDECTAMISISDQGVGISKDDLPHMFERFFRAKTAEGIKGTGIGLSVVKEFVDIHGGTISLDSVEGQGSTFAVRLPING